MRIKKLFAAICMIATVVIGVASALDPVDPRVNTATYTYSKSTTNVSLTAIGTQSGSRYYARTVATKTTQGTAVESATVEEYHDDNGRQKIQNKKAVCSIGGSATCNDITRTIGNSELYYRHQASQHNVTNVNYATDANIANTVVMRVD